MPVWVLVKVIKSKWTIQKYWKLENIKNVQVWIRKLQCPSCVLKVNSRPAEFEFDFPVPVNVTSFKVSDNGSSLWLFFPFHYYFFSRHPECDGGADGVQQQRLTLVEQGSAIAGVIWSLAETVSSQLTSSPPIIRETSKAEMNWVDKLLAAFGGGRGTLQLRFLSAPLAIWEV